MASVKLARGLKRSVLVAGCSNSALANVYLMSLSYAADITSSPLQGDDPAKLNPDMPGVFANLTSRVRNNATSFEIRTGYLGHCMKQNSGLWVCARNIEPLANVIRDQKASNIDPLNLVYMSKTFKDRMIFSGLIFPNWHTEVNSEGSDLDVKPFPSRAVSRVALGFVTLASLLTFVSVFWQHISSTASVTMHEELYYGVVKANTGVIAMVFGWGGFLASFLVVIGLLIMILSISLLTKLTDE
ncbi:hypothetical protein ACJ73_01281 [Blastomyces percursus]|uniref:Uncharacterized protein n=1 Tax=Blastomyces percursus TaxID=1658174 RepID=A0A1J9QFP7_9EURO|nr:hypothetical protein ACJ73_01281 [Blastomyces percursus]